MTLGLMRRFSSSARTQLPTCTARSLTAPRVLGLKQYQRTITDVRPRQPVAGDDPAAVGGGQQVAAAEAGLEVAGDAEAGEDTAEGRGLHQHDVRRRAGVRVRRHVLRVAVGVRAVPELLDEREQQRLNERNLKLGNSMLSCAFKTSSFVSLT